MKTHPVSLLVAGLLVPGLALAQAESTQQPQPSPGEPGGKHGAQRPFMAAWIAADSNHDGAISKEEFDLMPRIQNLPVEKRLHLFERLDKDADGKLSHEELLLMARAHNGQGPSMQRLWELDMNKDGGISLEEFKAGNLFKKLTPERQDKLFRRLDADHDGKITPKDKPEPARHRDGPPHPQTPDGTKPERHRPELRQLLRQLDQNADGALSFEEFRAGPGVKDLSESEQQARFAALDRNHDQLLNREDLPAPEPRPEPQRPNNPAPEP